MQKPEETKGSPAEKTVWQKDSAAEKQQGQRKELGVKRHRFRFTIYSGVLVLILLFLALQGKRPDKQLMFDENSRTDIYIHTETGQEPAIDPADFFPDVEGLSLDLFEYDLSRCSLEQPGEYTVPVYYDGKKTNAVLRIIVEDGSTGGEETAGVLSDTAGQEMAGEVREKPLPGNFVYEGSGEEREVEP